MSRRATSKAAATMWFALHAASRAMRTPELTLTSRLTLCDFWLRVAQRIGRKASRIAP